MPFIDKAVFAPLYILASFVKTEVPIGAWVYFQAFYLVPLVYISVFVPIPYLNVQVFNFGNEISKKETETSSKTL